MIHPDDIVEPRLGGWADDFNTYEEACNYYGCDTPAMLEYEAQCERHEWLQQEQDLLEQCGPQFKRWQSVEIVRAWDDCPF